ncbi:MAG: sigma 54-interacting transcriptional regulator [Myxococcota bacterium]
MISHSSTILELPHLPDDLQDDERRALERLGAEAVALAMAQPGGDEPGECPGCGVQDWIRDGRAQRRRGGDVQVFRCRACGKKRAEGADSPFNHPIFPPEVMLLALLLRRWGMALSRIAEVVGVVDEAAGVRRPNRQTVGRWVQRYDAVLPRRSTARDTVPLPRVVERPEEPELQSALEAQAAQRTRLASGEVLAGRFEVLEVLTHAGESGVLVVSDRWGQGAGEPGGATVVLKVLDSIAGGERLRREFEMRSRLRHPHIAPVLEYGTLPDGRRWFTQARVCGDDLYLASRGASFQRVLEWMVEVLRACAYLHDRGIVHRDLKPDNILVGEGGEPQVVDFGISLSRKEARDADTSGSLVYLAPEALAGAPATPAVDLYAVGVTFYHVLSRELPPEPGPPPALAAHHAEVPAWFDAVLARLCDATPERRFQSAPAVIEALTRASGIRFGTETPDTVLARVSGGPLVAREDALATLREALGPRGGGGEGAGAGEGAGVLVVGPPGIGKTRLLETWRQARQLAGGEVITGGLPTLLRVVVSRLGEGHPLVRHHDDMIRRLTGGSSDLPVPLRPRDGIFRDRDALIDLLSAGRLPGAVLVVDDLETADEPTLALVDMLSNGSVPGPALLLAMREGEPQSLASRAAGWQHLKTLRLQPLAVEGVETLLLGVFGDADLACELAPRLHAATEGNPRFVEEVLRVLVEQGAVDRAADGTWAVASEGALPVPRALVDACRGRVDALEPDARRFLDLLALAPGPVPRATARVLGAEAGLEALQRRALVRQVDVDGVPSVVTAHEGVREASLGARRAAAATVDGAERAGQGAPADHATLATAIEAAIPDDEARPVELLAALWSEVDDPARAVPWLARAASRARQRFDIDRAVGWLERLDDRLGDPRLLDRADLAPMREDVLRHLERMLRYRGRHEEQSVCLDRLTLLSQTSARPALALEAAALKALYWFDRRRLDLSRRLCRGHLEAARAQGDRRGQARISWVLAMVERASGETALGLELGAAALDALGDASDPEAVELRVQLLINQGNAHAAMARLDYAARAFERGLALSRQEELWSSAIVCTMNLGLCQALLGAYGRALDLLDRARTQAQRLGWTELGQTLERNQAEVERNVGLTEAASQRLERLLRLPAAPRASAEAKVLLANCRLDAGDRTEAATLIDSARAELRAAQLEPPAALELASAELLLADGTRESRPRAVAVLERVMGADATGTDGVRAAVRLAALSLEDGDAKVAWRHCEHAAAQLDGGPGRPREGLAEALHVQARVLLARGRRDEAAAVLRRAAEELDRQAADLEGVTRDAFLSLPRHRVLLDDARQVLGSVPGALARPLVADVTGEVRDLREVLQLGRTLTRATGLGSVVERALDGALSLSGLLRGHLLVQEGERFVVMGGRRAGRAPLAAGSDEPDPELVAAMVRAARTVTRVDPTGVHWVVPLEHGDTIIGALYLAGAAGGTPLGEHRRGLLEALADLVAMAVQHHLQVDELERLRRKVEADLTRTRARLEEEAVRRARAERVVEAERRTTRLRYRYDHIVHGDGAMRDVLAQVDRLVDRKVTVLIVGDSGTGKELIARALHYNGPRKSGPFVAINCAAIPENLIESELFGHVRGAFTGAVKTRRGHFELADGGTLFLDEIGEISPDLQVRLLRVLETGEVTPVGSSKRVAVDVRIVTATNRDLKAEVAAGRFREDLYYRINTIVLRLPRLRERIEDLPMLLEHFAQQVAQERGEAPVLFGPGILARLQAHSWPGNIRELRNVVEYATLFAEQGEVPAELSLPF